jgi:hypothetical protein
MNVRYRVTLTQYERDELGALLCGGKQAARKLKRAQILLAADAGVSDDEIAASVGVAARRCTGPSAGSWRATWRLTARSGSLPGRSKARPALGLNWIHKIKHDGYLLMARPDPVGIRLIGRVPQDGTSRSKVSKRAARMLCIRPGLQCWDGCDRNRAQKAELPMKDCHADAACRSRQ